MLFQRKILATIFCHPLSLFFGHGLGRASDPREQPQKDMQDWHSLNGMTYDPWCSGPQVSNKYVPDLHFLLIKTYQSKCSFHYHPSSSHW